MIKKNEYVCPLTEVLPQFKFRQLRALDSTFQDLVYLAGDVQRYLAAFEAQDKKATAHERGNMRSRIADLTKRIEEEDARMKAEALKGKAQ